MSNQIDSKGRRKAVKTIVGGVTALAAYNALPAKWGVPVVEQIFLPVHAATSGPVYYSNTPEFTVVEPQNDFMEMLADAGKAVSNFIVSEAHAIGLPIAREMDWHVAINGDSVTYSSSYWGSYCIKKTGSSALSSVTTLGSRIDGNQGPVPFEMTILENSGSTIKVQVDVDGTQSELICTRSNSPAPACTDDLN